MTVQEYLSGLVYDIESDCIVCDKHSHTVGIAQIIDNFYAGYPAAEQIGVFIVEAINEKIEREKQ